VTNRPAPAGWAVALVAVLIVSIGTAGVAQAPIRGLTNPAPLVKAYDLVYDADFAGAEAELARACGPAPREGCAVVGSALLWWRIYLDTDDHSQDAALLARVAGTIDLCERWTAREPNRAEAWLYLGAAYGVRVQYRAERGEYLGGARDGKRAKSALDRALALDPVLYDANFGTGMYEYYADTLPAVLKVLRWILMLPGGNKARGMARWLQTLNNGSLLQSEAAYQLHKVYIWYEKNPDGALALLAGLRTRYPHNPVFLRDVALVHQDYRHDPLSALQFDQALVAGAKAGTLREPELAESWGHLGAAEQFDALAEPDRAIEEYRALIERRPAKPYGALALAHLGLARALDRLGLRDQAVAAYRAAQAAAPTGDPRGVRGAALDAIARAPDRVTAEAYRLSIEGWRLFERGALDDALARLDRAVQAKPDDGVHRYRRGRVWLARGDRPRARADFERATQARPAPPAPMLAGAFLECGRIYEAAGDRARALSAYEWASRVQGADRDSAAAAAQALARLKH